MRYRLLALILITSLCAFSTPAQGDVVSGKMVLITFWLSIEMAFKVYEHQLVTSTYLLSGVTSTTFGTEPTG